jgi:hypothetical protein
MVKSLLGSIGSLIVAAIGHVGGEKLMDETFLYNALERDFRGTIGGFIWDKIRGKILAY